MNLQKGQKVDITKQWGFNDISVQISWKAMNPNMEVDASAFLLSGSGKCDQDENFIFYGNPVSSSEALSYSKKDHVNQCDFNISLKKLGSSIERISIALTIHEGDQLGYHFDQVSQIRLDILNSKTQQSYYTFEFGSGLTQETALVAGELYLHNGEWKFSAIGSGFFGGLTDLCKNYGLEVVEADHSEMENSPSTSNESPAKSEVAVTSSMEKKVFPLNIELKKEETVAIQKSPTVVAQLKWNNPDKDLDFYCFYITKDNKVGKVYYKNLGSNKTSPYIVLDGDSKNGGTETITIHRTENIKYVLFAAYSAFTNGTGSFNSMKANAIVSNDSGQKVIANLLKKNDYSYWVAIAHIDFTDENQMKVSHVENYSNNHSENSPLLYLDGTFLMDKGPVEFKDDDPLDLELDDEFDDTTWNKKGILKEVSTYLEVFENGFLNGNQMKDYKKNCIQTIETYIDSLQILEDMVYLSQFIPLIKKDQIQQIKILHAELSS